ncbi:TolC family protein [Thalassomonas sp. M1454]|uniref:TolC family protein n=1 Tax=Thalassomonas sp. M1454 TaxID=2594477 RepID=UPI00118114E7|nr:TolC family protein [Thalassomonas sp. M1454]TRX55153.1 TolC family protein [Thalassomonas sp. M1454]
MLNAKLSSKKKILFLLTAIVGFQANANNVLSFEQLIQLAHQNDPWLKGNKYKQSAVEARSTASSTLPDPQISISAMNLPTDSWDFDQEPMTQLKVGVSQMFPRGDTLTLKNAQLKIEASKFPYQRENREIQVTRQISLLWLEAYLAHKTIELINKDKSLFEQMIDITKASYSSTVGKTRQQDVIRAQLELIKLDERILIQKQKLESLSSAFYQWIYSENHGTANPNIAMHNIEFNIAGSLSYFTKGYEKTINLQQLTPSELAHLFASHPSVLALDKQLKAAQKGVELANQQYQPQWGVNASYSYRDDSPDGMERSDFFSVGVTFDLPLFTDNRQDQEVKASIAESEAVKTEKLLVIRNMIGEVKREQSNLTSLIKQQKLYETQLLKQTHDQAEASLTAYTNDDGDFAEVVRARISELNATIAKTKIDVELLKSVARLNYYFSSTNQATNLSKKDNHYAY